MPQHIGPQATIVEGAFDKGSTGTSAPSTVDVNVLVGADGFSSEQLVQQSRIELAVKFLFIFALVNKLHLSAAHCYKLSQRVDKLKKARRQKQGKRGAELLRRSAEEAEHVLTCSLENFDRAKDATVWLKRDYELSSALCQVTEMEVWTKEMRNTHPYITDSIDMQKPHPDQDRLIDTRTLSPNDSDIKQLNALLLVLQQKRQAILLAMEHNERRSMNLALDFLDTDSDGEIRPEDCPQLTPMLFIMLQASEGIINRKSMRAGVLKLSQRIGKTDVAIKDLKARGTQNTDALLRLQASYDADRSALRRLSHFFHQFFVQGIFNDVNEDIKRETIDLGLLERDLKEVEAQARTVTEPIHHSGAAIEPELQTAFPVHNQQDIVVVQKVLAHVNGTPAVS
jgi:hypothetical protein